MNNFYEITLADVKRIMIAKRYEVFTDGRPNIVGIRNCVRDSNKFDDTCFVWWNEDGKEIIHQYTITTHPGYYYLQNPIAGNGGTAILVPDQYIDCWGLGMHRQKQFALCQYYGSVKVYRDDNKDIKLDYNVATIQTGGFGIDLHHAAESDADIVGPWSAGCQVWRYHQPHEYLMNEFKRLSETYQFKKFSYTLIMQEDFE